MSTTPLNATTNAGWNPMMAPPLQPTPSTELPPEIAVEAKENYDIINIRPYFATLALEQEKLRDGKMMMKIQEVEKLHGQLEAIHDFLNVAKNALNEHAIKGIASDEIDLRQHSATIDKIRPLLASAPYLAKIVENNMPHKKMLETLCEAMTRKIDGVINPKIEKLQDEVTDLREFLNLVMPLLKELMKKYDEHINNIIRLSIPR